MADKKTATIVVATHKPYRMPADPIYQPLFVGACARRDEADELEDLGYAVDDSGENISAKNPRYSELTAMYWAWKNVDSDYIGLAHYRRHFAGRHYRKIFGDPFSKVLSGKELRFLMGKARIIVPVQQNYYIETLYSHYEHTHYIDQLDETRAIIAQRCPEYLDSYDRIVQQTHGCMFNMMIAERELFGEYCEWLFGILEELEERIDESSLNAFEARFYGRVSEIIFNVWLDRQFESGRLQRSDVREIPYIYMERINWIKKGGSFLQAKFFHKKYGRSF